MVFKLVRTDTEDPLKIQLDPGTHLIGRGKLLDCDDKRVSRKHGELVVTADTITIKALHQNPCFYIEKGSEETQILKLGCMVNLNHGDRFGLLPNSYWYELLHCSGPDVERSPARNSEENTQILQDETIAPTEAVTNRNGLENTTDCDDSVNSESELLPPGAPVVEEPPSLTPRDTSPLRMGDVSPSLIPQEPTDQSPQVHPDTNQGSGSPSKRCHSPLDSKEDVKKIKVEPVVKQEPDAQAGPSGDQGPSSSSTDDATSSVPGMPPSPQKPPGRERCMYGANCYRRNPQHKAQFSHPADADWGGGARGVCPYGRTCHRRDPRHWQHHAHPPGAAPPADRPGMRVVERRGNIFYINAHSVSFFDDHFQVDDSDGDSVDFDYEF